MLEFPTLTPGHHDVRGKDLLRDHIVWGRHCDWNILEVAPVGVQQGRAPQVLALPHGAVVVPGLGPGAREEEEAE